MFVFFISLSLNLWYHLILPHCSYSVFSFISSFSGLSSSPMASTHLRLWLWRLSRLVIITSDAASAFCAFSCLPPLRVSVSAGGWYMSSWSAALPFVTFCLPVDTEMLCLMRKEELSTWRSLFEHVQCAIMLDHLFLLRGW